MSNRILVCRNVTRMLLLATSMLVLLLTSGLTYGSTYASPLCQPRITISSPPVTLEAGTAGTSLIYTNNTSAKISTTAPAPTPTYYPNSYGVVTGTYFAGSVPSSVETVDTDYFVANSSGAPVIQQYNPSGYDLNGSTALVSGTVGDLALNNAVYMTFRSYVSATSASAKTDAFVAYRSNTGTNTLNSPKNRVWDGDTASWGNENELATAGSAVRWVRTAVCPKSERALEKIVVTLSDDGYLDAYVFDGTSWVVTNNIASIWTTAPSNPVRPFDIVYETSSGRALLVYDVNLADSTKDIGYRIWTFGSGWSQEYYIDFTGVASTNPVLSFIKLASNHDSASNQTALAFNDGTNGDAFAAIWSGTAWTKMTTLTTTNTISTRESVNIQYSTYYKKILAVAGNDKNSMAWKTYTQGDADWTAQTAFDPDADNNNEVQFGTLKRDPAATSTDDYIMYVGVNSLTDLNAFAFDMADTPPSRVNAVDEVDDAIDSETSRPIDFDWEPTGNKGLIVWGTTTAQINYNTYSISSGWGASWTTYVSCGSNIHPWIQLKSNPRNIAGDIKILGAVLEGTANDLGAIKWDGTTLTVIGTTTFTTDTQVATYECFDLKFQLFGDPTEFTSEVEFSGVSNSNNWGKIDWTVDSAWKTGSVAVTLQLYNYSLGNYPTSGNGFISYTSDATAETDQTKTQAITTNPTQFRDASGNWKIKIRGAKTSATQFDLKADWIEFKATNLAEYTVSTEFLFASMTKNTPTQLNFTVVSEYDIVSVSVTIQVWNYSSSPQAYVTIGEGYLTYLSSGANQTKLLSINTSPQFYASNGNARIKITGVLTTITLYQQKVNQVKLVYSYGSSPNYNYVLKIANQVSDAWKIRLRAYSQSNITRLNNCTIYFRNSTDGTSGQIYIISGVCTQPTGLWYDLPSSPAERYIALSLNAGNSEVSYIYVYLEILVLDKTTYAQYVLTFEIT